MRPSVLLLVVLVHLAARGQELRIPLNNGWRFRQVGTDRWYPAVVPGTVQQDLLRNGLIPDPLRNANVDSVRWVEQKDWEYVRSIEADQALLGHASVDLDFEGVDTYATVLLNDSFVLKADNMFQGHTSLNILPRLRPGPNELRVVLHSPIAEGRKRREAYGIQLPHDSDPSGTSPYVRKAAFQYGWDIGPRIVTLGIWQEVSLHCWGQVTALSGRVDEEWRKDAVVLTVLAHFISQPYQGPECRLVALWDGKEVAHVPSRGYAAEHPRLRFTVRHPERWWPAGSGDRVMHRLRLELRHGRKLLASWERPYAFRTIELDRSPDAEGTPFRFVVNGKPLFMKGCNLVPPAVMISARDDGAWVSLVKDMQRAGMNMVRVWAGGVYPAEAFLHACDTAGILVWQDLMFANMSPYGEEDRHRIDGEVLHQLVRMSDHPCVALWCGNNELDVAWRNWGWQDRYGIHGADSLRVIADHDSLFQGLHTRMYMRSMEQVYTHTSPLSNWGNAEGLRHGDLHYWGVWHGDSAFSSFRHNVGRFVSEYGFQSYPDSATLATQLDRDQLHLGSAFLADRQKSYKTDKPILTAIEREFGVHPLGLGEFILFSQLAQAEAYRQAIWAHVTDQPRCMGTLFWQLNDVWAGPTWSTVDHAGTWKPAMYEVARSYRPFVLDLEMADGRIALRAWNELPDRKRVRLVVQLFRTDGLVMWNDTSELVTPSGAVVERTLSLQELLQGGSPQRHLVRVVALDERGEVLAERALPLARMGDMAWERPEVRLARSAVTGNSTTYTLTTDRPVPVVWLEGREGAFSENYFTLMPGTPRSVVVTGLDRPPDLRHWP